jgi:hypothetical protein
MGVIKRFTTVCATVAVLAIANAPPAAANGDADTDEAKVLVQQAIALIVNDPHDTHAIEDRIEHAREAPHHEGVDLDLVDEAAAAFHDGDHDGARELLQASIGAGPVSGDAAPMPIRETHGEPGQPVHETNGEPGQPVRETNGEPGQPVRETNGEPGQPVLAVGAATGTTVILDEYHPATTLGGGEVVLLVLSAAGIALGVLLAWRFRPLDTVRQLRRAADA